MYESAFNKIHLIMKISFRNWLEKKTAFFPPTKRLLLFSGFCIHQWFFPGLKITAKTFKQSFLEERLKPICETTIGKKFLWCHFMCKVLWLETKKTNVFFFLFRQKYISFIGWFLPKKDVICFFSLDFPSPLIIFEFLTRRYLIVIVCDLKKKNV